MADWFEWNGVSCTTKGIYVSSQPVVTLASERLSNITIPGRPGSYTQTQGENIFESVTYSIPCFAEHLTESELKELDSWLRGSGKLVLPNRQIQNENTRYYIARHTTALAPSFMIRGLDFKSFTLTFLCQPFLYIEADPIILNGPGTSSVLNKYELPAKPIIKVERDSSVESSDSNNRFTISIGQYELTYNYLTPECPNVVLDCESMFAYYHNETTDKYYNTCSHVVVQYKDDNGGLYSDDDEWPMFEENSTVAISCVGAGVKKITIEPYWRTL